MTGELPSRCSLTLQSDDASRNVFAACKNERASTPGADLSAKTQLGDYYNTSWTTGENFNEWEFRKYYYNKIPEYCGKNVIFDKNDPQKMSFVGCNRLSCPRCRPKIKMKLMDRIIETAIEYGLTRQLILTCPGKTWRRNVSPKNSFIWLNKKFNSFKKIYERLTEEKLHYIKLPRSQKSGYCHQHILINKYIPGRVIEDIISRIGIGTNYKINFYDVQRLRSYLKNDFQKEHEWYIPVGMRHVSSSMELMDDGFRKSIFVMWLPGTDCFCMIVFGRYCSPEKKYDFVYDVIQNYGDHPPPLWLFTYFYKEIEKIMNSKDYVSNLKKLSLPGNRSDAKRPAGFYQKTIGGRLFRIQKKFENKKFTRQINFQKDLTKKEFLKRKKELKKNEKRK